MTTGSGQRQLGLLRQSGQVQGPTPVSILEVGVFAASTFITMAPASSPARNPATATRDADSVPSGSSGTRHADGTTDAPAEERRESSDPTVIMDSGASYHAAADRWWLSGFDAAARAGHGAVHRTRDGTELPVAGAGTLTSEKFQLPDVLHIPGLVPGTVLASVQQLARRGYLVMLGGAQCLVVHKSAGKLVGQGRLQRHGGLYILEFLKIPLDAPADGATDSNSV